jgi:hypothetical protein
VKRERSYASGFVDALALVAIAIMLIGAALVAGGCKRNPTIPPGDHVLLDCRVVDLETGRSVPCH